MSRPQAPAGDGGHIHAHADTLSGFLRIPEPVISLFGRSYTVDEYCACHGDEAVTIRKSEVLSPGREVVLMQRVPRAFWLRIQDMSRVDTGWRLAT